MLDPYKFIYIHSIVFLKFFILFLIPELGLLCFSNFVLAVFFVMKLKYVEEKL